MTQSTNPWRVAVFSLSALLLGILSGFFVFYTVRLFYVTQGLRVTRAGGQGAYIGALAFPLLATMFGFGAWRCWRTARRS